MSADNYFVMGSEPIPGCTPNDIREWYSNHHDEPSLAQAYAAASNKIWWVEDDIYDYEQGSPAYEDACRIAKDWGVLMDELKSEIFEILMNEGITIPEKGQIIVLVPFMERNGFRDGNGWWILK